jgi:2-amino-4-hydroxy-6-hydroxymethyldihydropteridine diphosphokinase
MIILGLGSNVGDRAGFLRAAVGRLGAILGDMRVSRVLESPALLPENAPADWNTPYLNMAVSGTSTLSAPQLLDEVKKIERDLGRIPRGFWAPREIDIDILSICGQCCTSPELTLPHAKILSRDFVLLPIVDVAPDWRYPLAGEFSGKTASEIAAAKGFALGNHLRDTGLVIHA